MEINEKIKRLRINKQKTQREISEIIHTTQQYYCNYELGKRQIPIHTIVDLCNYYEVSADYLLGLRPGLKYPNIT